MQNSKFRKLPFVLSKSEKLTIDKDTREFVITKEEIDGSSSSMEEQYKKVFSNWLISLPKNQCKRFIEVHMKFNKYDMEWFEDVEDVFEELQSNVFDLVSEEQLNFKKKEFAPVLKDLRRLCLLKNIEQRNTEIQYFHSGFRFILQKDLNKCIENEKRYGIIEDEEFKNPSRSISDEQWYLNKLKIALMENVGTQLEYFIQINYNVNNQDKYWLESVRNYMHGYLIRYSDSYLFANKEHKQRQAEQLDLIIESIKPKPSDKKITIKPKDNKYFNKNSLGVWAGLFEELLLTTYRESELKKLFYEGIEVIKSGSEEVKASSVRKGYRQLNAADSNEVDALLPTRRVLKAFLDRVDQRLKDVDPIVLKNLKREEKFD